MKIRTLLAGLALLTGAFGIQIVGSALLPSASLSSASAEDLLPGVAPTLNLQGSFGNNGFTVAVTNYDSSNTYSFSVTQGTVSTTIRTPTGGQRMLFVNVQNIPIDDSATLTVTASKSGYTSESASIVGYAKKSALVPIFGTPEPTFDGFTVAVTNYQPGFTWTFTNDLGVYATIDSSGLITVTRLNVPDPTTLFVITSRTGYLSGQTSVVGQNKPLTESPTPTLGAFELGADGLTVPITNYDPAFNWAIGTTGGGAAAIDPNGLITVTDLIYGQPVTVQVTLSRYGYTTKSITFEAQPLMPPYVPSFGEVVSTSDGFTTELTDFDETFAYQVSVSFGSATINGRYITVIGLEPGQASTLTVLKTREDSVPAVARVTGNATLGTYTPLLGNTQRQEDGYAIPFLNYDPAFDWNITILGNPSPGVSAMFTYTWFPGVGFTNLLNVVGAAHGETVDLVVTASRPGYATTTLQVTGAAISATEPIQFGRYVRTSDGFIVEYLNRDESYTWMIAVDNGNVTYGPGNTLVVSGLAPGDRALIGIFSQKTDALTGYFEFEGRALASDTPSSDSTDGSDSSDSSDATDTTDSTDSSDSTDSNDSTDSSVSEHDDSQESILAEAAERARIREVAEAVIRAREEEKAQAEAKLAAEAAGRIAKDMKAIEHLVNSSKNISAAELRGLSENQVALLPVKTTARLSLSAIAAMTPKQAAGLTAAQLRGFTVAMLRALKPAAVGELKPETLAALSVNKLKALSRAQVKQIWLAQWLQLDPEQRKAIRR